MTASDTPELACCAGCFCIPALHEKHTADCPVAADQRIAEYVALQAALTAARARIEQLEVLRLVAIGACAVLDRASSTILGADRARDLLRAAIDGTLAPQTEEPSHDR